METVGKDGSAFIPACETVCPVPIRRRFTAPVQCNCGQHGTAFWEENAASAPFGRRPVLLDVSSGFYVRPYRRGIAMIACGLCEKTVAFSRAGTGLVRPLCG